MHLGKAGSFVQNGTNSSTIGRPLNPALEEFMMFSTSLLWLLVPGCGFFYSGLARSSGALSMVILSLWSACISSIQWWIFGYSLAFSTTSGNPLIGDFTKIFYIGVLDDPYPSAPKISELSFSFYQGITATIPGAIICGAMAERARIGPALLFLFLWDTFVFCPVAFWSLCPQGWSFRLGVLDFAGAGPVHVPAAAAAMAYSYVLGPRDSKDRTSPPHNMIFLVVGTVLIWFSSFGNNLGSALGPTLQAVNCCLITNLAACFGAITWALLEFCEKQHWDGIGFCTGAVIGLVAITPASGLIHPASTIPISLLSVFACRWALRLKAAWKFDDSLDVVAIHGVAGTIGILLTGVFAQKFYGGEESGDGGMIDGNYNQIFIQIADTLAGFIWSLLVSLGLLLAMDKIPGLSLRLEKAKMMDEHELGVLAYEHLEEIKSDGNQYFKVRVKTLQVKVGHKDYDEEWKSFWD